MSTLLIRFLDPLFPRLGAGTPNGFLINAYCTLKLCTPEFICTVPTSNLILLHLSLLFFPLVWILLSSRVFSRLSFFDNLRCARLGNHMAGHKPARYGSVLTVAKIGLHPCWRPFGFSTPLATCPQLLMVRWVPALSAKRSNRDA